MIGKRSLVLAAALAMILAGGSAFAGGDAAKGEKAFKKCKSCHSLEAGKNKAGPSLAGIVGRKAAAADGYKYSASLKKAAAKGLAWDEESLENFLKNPKKFLREYLGDGKAKSKMVYKLKKDNDRNDLIAYLEKLGK